MPLAEAGPLPREAEEIGFAGIWFTETAHNPFPLSAAAALAPSVIQVGTNIAVAFPRSPIVTAQACGTSRWPARAASCSP
jgi:alkanesulfonate monooxygenase SsuD/methylene tetrahydromethanopterin reductase-like flavin-dependent oxidoreductase (luciferase family)